MTNLTLRVNNSDPDIAYGDTGATFVNVNLTNDYIIWTAGSSDVADGQDEPTEDELNQAYSIIDTSDLTVEHCLLFDYSASKLDEIEGMGENKRYVFCFSFDGATASEPQLEAWDNSTHNTVNNNVLGVETGEDSFIKAVCTTLSLPGAEWAGTPIAGANDVLLLNNGNGALSDLATGETSQELYCNVKIVIPANYDTPAIETFVLTVRYTWM